MCPSKSRNGISPHKNMAADRYILCFGEFVPCFRNFFRIRATVRHIIPPSPILTVTYIYFSPSEHCSAKLIRFSRTKFTYKRRYMRDKGEVVMYVEDMYDGLEACSAVNICDSPYGLVACWDMQRHLP